MCGNFYVLIHKDANEFLEGKEINPEIKKRFKNKVKPHLEKAPFPTQNKNIVKCVGYDFRYRYHLSDYRIIFEVIGLEVRILCVQKKKRKRESCECK